MASALHVPRNDRFAPSILSHHLSPLTATSRLVVGQRPDLNSIFLVLAPDCYIHILIFFRIGCGIVAGTGSMANMHVGQRWNPIGNRNTEIFCQDALALALEPRPVTRDIVF